MFMLVVFELNPLDIQTRQASLETSLERRSRGHAAQQLKLKLGPASAADFGDCYLSSRGWLVGWLAPPQRANQFVGFHPPKAL